MESYALLDVYRHTLTYADVISPMPVRLGHTHCLVYIHAIYKHTEQEDILFRHTLTYADVC